MLSKFNKTGFLLGSASMISMAVYAVEGDERELELNQEVVIQRTLDNYFAIRIEEMDVERSRVAVEGSRGEYDPSLSLSGRVGEVGSERSENGRDGSFSVVGMGLDGTLSSGTGYSVEVSSSDYRGESDDDVATSVASISISQPLLRDWGGSEVRNRIRISRSEYDLSSQAFAQLVMDAVTEAQFAYLNAYTAEETLKVLEENRDLAKLLVEANRKRIEIGTMAPSDLYQAEAEYAARESQVYAAELRLGDLRNTVRRFVSGESDQVLGTNLRFVSPEAVKRILVDPEGDVEVALEMRPDYQRALVARERANWSRELSRSRSKARIDLVGGVDFERSDDRVSRSWSDGSADDTSVFLGLDFEWPVRNRFASAERIRADFQQKQAELSIVDLRQLIYLEIDNAARRIDSDWSRLQSARKGLSLAEKSLKAEQKKLQSGNSSSFIVLRLQSDLAQSRIRELNAMNDYRKAAIDYERRLGITLEKNKIFVTKH